MMISSGSKTAGKDYVPVVGGKDEVINVSVIFKSQENFFFNFQG